MTSDLLAHTKSRALDLLTTDQKAPLRGARFVNIDSIRAALHEVREAVGEMDLILDACDTLDCDPDPEAVGFVAGRLDGARLRLGDELALLADRLAVLVSLDEP